MSILFTFIVSVSGIIGGRLLFRKWINHLTLYCIIMGGLIFFYELKMLPYRDIIPLAWFYVAGSFLAFLFGILSVIAARKLFDRPKILTGMRDISFLIFKDNGKALKYSVLFFSGIALFVALQRWYVLIKIFGSVPAVLVNASLVYQMNVHQEIKDFIPILPAFVYVAIFLSGIYTAYKGRFSFLSFFPFIGIILKELTYFGRAEMLLTLLEFLFTFFLFRHLLKTDIKNRYKFSRRNAYIAATVLLSLLIGTASFIRLTRGHYEHYSGASRELNQLKDSFIFSPSVYLYLSSDFGVFSQYLENEKENVKLGENTFFLLHSLMGKLGMRENPVFFQKGYYIPMWTNTGTYLRDLHADFGVTGIMIGPYLIGLIITWLWFKFYEERSLTVFAFLIYFYLIIGFSFLTLVTRLNQWYFSLFIIVCYLPLLEKMALQNSKAIRDNS